VNRIDEALRRASEGRTGSRGDHQAHFVSAWSERTTPAATIAPPVSKPPQPDASDGLLLAVAPRLARPDERGGWENAVLAAAASDELTNQQYRRLAATLHKAQAIDGVRSVLVTSANGADGKTVTAFNLALILSESYQRHVLLIDADLRNPSICQLIGMHPGGGLNDALKSAIDAKVSAVPLTPRLTLLPGGRPEPDPTSGLTSDRMRRIFDEAVNRFDWVVVDAPPVVPVADAAHLAEMVDRTLLVIRAERTQYSAVQKAIEALGRERLLGVVLNGVDRSVLSERDETYYSYAASTVKGLEGPTMSTESASLLPLSQD
jgi:capsular exopolysaccharide synthesis family protein